MGEGSAHIPVMLSEVIQYLQPTDGETYIDATFGAGGYTRQILNTASCQVIAFDRDINAYKEGIKFADQLRQESDGRLSMVHAPFSRMKDYVEHADGIVMDLGVSSMQIDQPERGFSFRFDGPLDMRMDTTSGQSAADIVNSYEEKELQIIISKYGEEKFARRIARAIVQQRQEKPFETTMQLAQLITDKLPFNKKDHSHPATRTFQALRIAVNDELGELERALQAAQDILRPGGRLVVATFHSLEDRIVKLFFNKCALKDIHVSRHMPLPNDASYQNRPSFEILTRKALIASQVETANNPRARSAKLRAACRTQHPAVIQDNFKHLGKEK